MKRNPQDGITIDTAILLGMGTALLGAIVYAIYEIQQTNAQIAAASDSATSVGSQIGEASSSAQNVADQIQAANQTVQQQANSPAVQATQGLAAWWNSL